MGRRNTRGYGCFSLPYFCALVGIDAKGLVKHEHMVKEAEKKPRQRRGRFAPSPTGFLHLGNVFIALLAWLEMRQKGGAFVLRIEDIDEERSHEEYACALMEDLKWLGLDWDEGPDIGGTYAPYTQQARYAHYETALAVLRAQGLLYPCFCSRARLMGVGAPHEGEVRVYDGHCFRMTEEERIAAEHLRRPSFRVHVPAKDIVFIDATYGVQRMNLAQSVGDFRVRRSDGLYAYPLATPVDDGAMQISDVLRGRDLLGETPAQIWLLETLGYAAPRYRHVPMLVDANGKRLSKRQKGLTVRELRAAGKKPAAILGELSHACGIIEQQEKLSARELVAAADFSKLRREDIAIETLLL